MAAGKTAASGIIKVQRLNGLKASEAFRGQDHALAFIFQKLLSENKKDNDMKKRLAKKLARTPIDKLSKYWTDKIFAPDGGVKINV